MPIPPRGPRFRLGRFRLDYDRNYGIDRRTGWSAAVGGSFVAQFVSLRAALWAVWARRKEIA